MRKDKLEIFINTLEKKKEISFYLYNAEYSIIKSNDNNYIIKQFGIEYTCSYSNISDLFSKYMVYGELLKDCFKDIKIIWN